MVRVKLLFLLLFNHMVFRIFSLMISLNLSGLADPYVKGQLGPYRFRTKIQKKTLSPKWHEEFKIPICTWESANVLSIEVRDKDHFVDDTLGYFSKPCNTLPTYGPCSDLMFWKKAMQFFFLVIMAIMFSMAFIYLSIEICL